MRDKNFDTFISELKSTISGYDFFTDFDKVRLNIKKIDKQIQVFEELIGSLNLKDDLITALKSNPELYHVLPMLIANRKDKFYVYDEKEIYFDFKGEPNQNLEDFITKTGIIELFNENLISSIRDYLIGVEVGLDSNARKNRTGSSMEKTVKKFIENNGLTFFEQSTISKVNKEIELSEDLKRKVFDFIILKKDKIYLLETNFYSSGGSKLNETARSYVELNEAIRHVENVEFIWVTDGQGWFTAKNSLRNAYQFIDHLFNITDLESKILEEI